MAERLNAAVSKTVSPVRGTEVRILVAPYLTRAVRASEDTVPISFEWVPLENLEKANLQPAPLCTLVRARNDGKHQTWWVSTAYD